MNCGDLKPLAGKTVAGREDVLQAWDVSLQRIEPGRTDEPIVFYGLRGVGKTALMAEFRHHATSRGWIVAKIEPGGSRSLRELLWEALYEPLSDLPPSVGARVLKALKTALSFKASYDAKGVWSFGLDPAGEAGGAGP